ncbi:hypothetical protein FRACYDRAFT_263843 [Fragilariopsis cylindrus CCMP1102]|uniref:Uncharacterized protein n=1 Tax=Fragilariopsis cylindrus CCMP1102 TaxID=635003 RepID=A0A1E7EWR7_9STRA|nr:hypothetical protein FRACYDRAFT_263843 [Fragilariopsis cylindrus CCMP1102]|eukprot:OEU10306.1 hypothetical protein FRACYDRAFT_263843 [Fragilariopsis cylindrus CCMP1102]
MSNDESSSSSTSSNDKEEEQNTTSSSVSTSSTSWFEPLLSLKQQWEEFDDGQRINRLKACQILDEILNNCQQQQIAQQQQNPSQQQQQSSQQQQQQNDDVDDPIESVSIGLRNMKYFGWRGILSSKKAGTDTDTDEIAKIQDENGNSNASNNGNEITNNDEHEKNRLVFHSKIRQSCSREQHAVWACRSVSTGCGKDLSLLKRCFEDIDIDTETEQLPPQYRILTTPYTNYEGIVEKTEEEEAQAQSLTTTTTSTTTSSVDNNAKSSTSSSLSSSLSLKQRIPCYDIQRQLGSCVTINGKQLLERKQKRETEQ